MKSVDLVRSWEVWFESIIDANLMPPQNPPGTPRPLPVDWPGDFFDTQKLPRWWVEPRLQETDHDTDGREEQEVDGVFIQIRGFVKTWPKGGRRNEGGPSTRTRGPTRAANGAPDLEAVIDVIRLAVDVTAGAPLGIQITDTNGDAVGTLQFGRVRILRAYGVLEVFPLNNPSDGLDVATITVEARAVGLAGGTC